MLEADAPVLLDCDCMFKIGKYTAYKSDVTEQGSVSSLDRFGGLRWSKFQPYFILYELIVHRKKTLS